jgi:hypothetical protein
LPAAEEPNVNAPDAGHPTKLTNPKSAKPKPDGGIPSSDDLLTEATVLVEKFKTKKQENERLLVDFTKQESQLADKFRENGVTSEKDLSGNAKAQKLARHLQRLDADIRECKRQIEAAEDYIHHANATVRLIGLKAAQITDEEKLAVRRSLFDLEEQDKWLSKSNPMPLELAEILNKALKNAKAVKKELIEPKPNVFDQIQPITPDAPKESLLAKLTRERETGRGEFVPIFTAKGLSGWERTGFGTFAVYNQTLHMHPGAYRLFTPLDDYKDFHLRMKIAGDDATVRVIVRMPWDARYERDQGYEVHLSFPRQQDHRRPLPVFLCARGKDLAMAKGPAVAANEWCVLDVVAVGSRLTVKVNEAVVLEFFDKQDWFTSGRVGFRCWRGTAEFRSIEIKELQQ